MVLQIAADQSDDKAEAKTVEKAETSTEKKATENGTEEEKKENEETALTDDGNDDRLYVQRAMAKAERISILKDAFNTSHESKQKQHGVNLYVKNLDDQVVLSSSYLYVVYTRFSISYDGWKCIIILSCSVMVCYAKYWS